MTDYFQSGSDLIDVNGFLVERDALRVAEAIRDYDPNLVVLCVDPAHVEGISEEPFVIAERDGAGILHTVLRAWTLDNTVLDRIKLADTQKFDVYGKLLRLEQDNKKQTDYQYNQRRDETKDIVAHIVADRKSRYTVPDDRTGEIITFYDDRPAERK